MAGSRECARCAGVVGRDFLCGRKGLGVGLCCAGACRRAPLGRCRERPVRVVWRGGRHPPRTGARVVPSSPGRRRLFTPQTQHAGHPLKQAQNCPPPTSAPTRLRDLMAQSLLKAPARVSLAPPVSPAPACLRALRLSYSADYPMTHFEGHIKSLLRVQTTDLKGSAPPSFPLPCFFSVGLLTIQHS